MGDDHAAAGQYWLPDVSDHGYFDGSRIFARCALDIIHNEKDRARGARAGL